MVSRRRKITQEVAHVRAFSRIHSTQENYVLWAISHARNRNISRENQETSILTIKKVKTRLKRLLYVKERLPEKNLQTMNKGQYNKDKTRTRKPKYTDLQYEKQWQSFTCSATINSSMYKSAFSITTSWLTSSAPYHGHRPV